MIVISRMSLFFRICRKSQDSRARWAGNFLWKQNISNMVLMISTKRGDEAVEDLCERITTHGVMHGFWDSAVRRRSIDDAPF